MSYSPAVRFGARPSVGEPLIELLTSTTRTTVQGLGLARLIEVKRRRAREQEDAVRAVKAGLLLDSADSFDAPQQLVGTRTGRSLLNRVLKFVGKQLLKRIVKPIIRFAIRAAMQVARIAIRQVLRMVLMPVLEGIFLAAVANPVGAVAVLGLLAAGGVGYWAWKEFFQTKDAPPIAATDVAPVSQGQEQAADVDVSTTLVSAPIAQANVPAVSLTDRVTAPVRFVRNIASTNRGFAGFGDDVDRSIKVASQMFGLPEDVLRGFIKMEAGWTGAMSPTGAIGAGQFIQRTWDGLARTADGRAIGMTVIGNRFRRADDPRRDQHINILATSLLARDNARQLRAAGLPLTGENLYMMHNIGPGIIPVMLGRPASERTLLAMRQNGMQPNQTAAQFLTMQKQRFMSHYETANRAYTAMDVAALQQQEAIAAERKKKKNKGVTQSDVTQTKTNTVAPKDATIVKGPGKTLVAIK